MRRREFIALLVRAWIKRNRLTKQPRASLPYTLTMIGFMIGGIMVGRLADRFGILPPLAGATILMGFGYILTASAPTLPVFAVVSGLTIGLGSAASFAPLVADASLWFDRHRGLAISLATMLPLALVLRRRPVFHKLTVEAASTDSAKQAVGSPPNVTHALLTLAGLCCCVAMSMPQVHLIAYCADLGYGPARGAEMLAAMLGFGVVSRLIFGWVLNRVAAFRLCCSARPCRPSPSRFILLLMGSSLTT